MLREFYHKGEILLLLYENKAYQISNEYERVYLFNKTNNVSVVIGDHYGDPTDAIISVDCKFCVSIGYGAIVYYLSPPMLDYNYEKNSQWLDIMRDPKNALWFDSVKQIDESTVHLYEEQLDEESVSIFQLNVYTGEITHITKLHDESTS